MESMDQKRAMLYPPIDHGNRNSLASTDMGLPMEAPPSYDTAMGTGGGATAVELGWASNGAATSAATATATEIILQAPTSSFGRNEPTTRSFIVVQPALPRQPHHHQQLPQQEYQQQLPAVPASAAVASPLPKLGPNPCMVTCPACGACKTTSMSYTPNSRTHLCALLLCLVGWCCCACCVPYCMKSCRTGNHYCRKCNTFLGSFQPPEN